MADTVVVDFDAYLDVKTGYPLNWPKKGLLH